MAHFVKKKKVARTNKIKKLWSALFASYVHNLAVKLKGYKMWDIQFYKKITTRKVLFL